MVHPEHPVLMESPVSLDEASRVSEGKVVSGVPMVCPESPVHPVTTVNSVTLACPDERATLGGMECLVVLATGVLMECLERGEHPPL